MRARVSVVLGIMIFGGLAGGALAQGGATHSHGSGHGAALTQGHLEAQRCASRFEEVVGQGLGFGLAFAADQNGYPGPIHVLELKELLGLTAAQEAQARSLYHAMLAESRPKSAQLLEAEARLRAFFAGGRATEERLSSQVDEVERRRAELRAVHLRYHVRMRAVLDEGQRVAYHQARWGVASR